MKKLVATLLSLTMICALLAGCGQSSNQPSDAGTQNQPGTTTTPAPSENDNPKNDDTPATTTDWPNGPIQLYVGFNAGGDTDLHARKAAELMSKELGQTVIVTNMAGASGSVAAQYVLDAPADGYSVLFHQSTFHVASLMGVCDFSFEDFANAGNACLDNATILCVNPAKAEQYGYTTMEGFVDYARNNPGELLFATAIGGFTQLQGFAIADAIGTTFTHVDIGGTTEFIPAVVNGDCDFALLILGSAQQYIESGALLPLVVCTEDSSLDIDIPDLGDVGIEFGLSKQFSFYFHPDTDPAIVEKWEAALERVVNSQEWADYCAGMNVDPYYLGGDDDLEFSREQYAIMERYAELMNLQ